MVSPAVVVTIFVLALSYVKTEAKLWPRQVIKRVYKHYSDVSRNRNHTVWRHSHCHDSRCLTNSVVHQVFRGDYLTHKLKRVQLKNLYGKVAQIRDVFLVRNGIRRSVLAYTWKDFRNAVHLRALEWINMARTSSLKI